MKLTYILGLLLLGVGIFLVSYQYSKRFLDWLRFQSLGTRDYIVERLGQMFVEIPPHRILIGLFAISLGLGLVVFAAFMPDVTPGLIFGAIATVVGWKAPKPIVDWMYTRRVDKLVRQMIDGLGLMSNGLKSGLSIVQSMALVTQEMENPIQQEFNLILSENKLGVSLEEAFQNFSRRVKSDDVEMFVTSVNILKETGGNLAETFDTIVMTIRERIKVENKIKAMTTQGFYQGMFVMAIPPIMFVVFTQSDPEFMKPMTSTAIGWIVIAVILALMAVAFFVIMKIVKIEV